MKNRSIHQIVASVEQPALMLLVRSISCYQCDECVLGNVDKCNITDQIGKQRHVQMKLSAGNVTDTHPDEVPDPSIEELISEGSVVAVLADDPEHDYYLLKVADEPNILNSNEADAWGGEFPEGANIVRGILL